MRRDYERLLWLILLAAPLLLAASTLINLATQVKGTLPVGNGGTGNTTGQSTNTYLQNQISGNVTLGTSSYTPASGTFPAVTTSAAGVWLVAASVALQTTSTTSSVNFTCELYDGSAVLSSGYAVVGAVSSAAARNEQMTLTATKSEAGAVTFTARCTSTTASQLMIYAAANNSGGSNASTITAVRIQ